MLYNLNRKERTNGLYQHDTPLALTLCGFVNRIVVRNPAPSVNICSSLILQLSDAATLRIA